MEKLELIFASNGPAKLASKVRTLKAIIANAWTGKGTPKGLLVAELVGVIALLSRIEYDEFDEIKNSANNPVAPHSTSAMDDDDETDDTLLMSQNKTLQVPGAAAANGDQLQAGPSGDNRQDDDNHNSGGDFTEVRRKKKTSGNQSKRPPVCRSTWRRVKCERTACGHAHPPLCKLKSCFPQRDYKCQSWHGSGSSTAASGNCSGGRGPPSYPKSHSSTNARSNKPNGSSLGLRALQDKLAISDLRLEVARLKTKQKAPTLPKRGSPPTPFIPPSQPQLSQPQDLAGLDLVGMLAIMQQQQQQFGVQLAAITASLRVTSK
jgi:hypothetical protein